MSVCRRLLQPVAVISQLLSLLCGINSSVVRRYLHLRWYYSNFHLFEIVAMLSSARPLNLIFKCFACFFEFPLKSFSFSPLAQTGFPSAAFRYDRRYIALYHITVRSCVTFYEMPLNVQGTLAMMYMVLILILLASQDTLEVMLVTQGR